MVLITLLVLTLARRMGLSNFKVDERGNPIPLFDVVEGMAFDIDRAPNGVMGARHRDLKSLPLLTAQRQDATTERDQAVDLQTRSSAVRRLERNLPKSLTVPPGMPTANEKFLLPSWDLVNGWDGNRGIPYYTAKGLDFIDIDLYSHLSVIGMTGSLKSRGFIRPFIACALAAGHKVVIIGKSADYWPFEGHPNAKLLKVSKITEPEQAVRYRDILKAIVEEMNHRDDVLTGLRKSTWMHAGRERTIIALDEVGNALRIMRRVNAEYANECMAWIEALVSEGRKAGFNILLANQRATGMASILSQTGKAIFRVEPDEEKAHKSLAGASSLAEGYFLAKFGSSKLAGAFEPTDEELITFLKSRPVRELEKDDWIDGDVTEQQITTEPDAVRLPAPEITPVADPDIARILELKEQGKSESVIIRELWGVTGGGSYYRRQAQVRAVLGEKVTSSSTSAPVLGSEMAIQGT